MKTSVKNILAPGIPIVFALISILRIWPVLPAVMQDEYVYSIQSRFTPFAEQLYPNYLFSALYSTTSVCGPDFYSCGKALNSVFFFVFLFFIYLISNRLLGQSWASAITTLAAISPVHVYVSYFMPEMMYFAFITAAIWLTLLAGKNQKLSSWLAVGALLGLSSLVKPHALFALPAILLFAFLVTLRTPGGKAVLSFASAGSTLVIFAITKFGLGFAFAGTAGLSLFGSSYESSLDKFVSGPQASQADLFAQTASTTQPPIVAPVASEASQPNFFEVFIPHSLAHLALLLTIAGVPLLLSLKVLKDAVKEKQEISESSQYLLLISLVSISFALVVGAFEGMVTQLGDDHSSRIITRYYEFLVPLLIIAAVVFAKFVEPKVLGRSIQALVLIVASIFGAIYLSGIKQSFADSILLSGYLSSAVVIPFIAAIGIGTALVWMVSSNAGSKAIVYVATPLVILIAGTTAQGFLNSQVGTQKASFDVAGQKAHELLREVEGDKILVVGPMRTQNFTTKFWIDKPNISDFEISESESLDLSQLGSLEYVVVNGNVSYSGKADEIFAGEGFKILRAVR